MKNKNVGFNLQDQINDFVEKVMVVGNKNKKVEELFSNIFIVEKPVVSLEELLNYIFPAVWGTASRNAHYHLGKFGGNTKDGKRVIANKDNAENYENFKKVFIASILESKNQKENTAKKLIENLHKKQDIKIFFKECSGEYSYNESIGLIQKLVNILFKYLYAILNYNGKEYSVPQSLKNAIINYFNFDEELQCPLDSVVFGKIRKNIIIDPSKDGIEKIVKIGNNNQVIFTGKNNSKPWSRLILEEYNKVQNLLEKHRFNVNQNLSSSNQIKNLLELDFYFWTR